jgi:dihydroorotate dehydrogenase (NAD+) catalytic subunit
MDNFLQTIAGQLKLKNPVILASGVCGFGEKNLNVLNKCGAIVFKTVSYFPKRGNPTPRIVDLGFGIINSIGLENPGVFGIKEKIKYIKRIKTSKIASFLMEEKANEALDKLEEYEMFDGYEINLSCPNVEKEEWFYNFKLLATRLKEIRKKVKKPVFLKLSYEMDVLGISKIAKEEGYDAVVLLNSFKSISVNYKEKKFNLGNIYGGYSGPAIKVIVQRYVYDIKKSVDIDVIACGGVVNESDVIEYLLVGASAVQIGSGYFRDPQLPVKCIKFLNNYLKKEKLSLKDLTGYLLRKQ